VEINCKICNTFFIDVPPGITLARKGALNLLKFKFLVLPANK